MFCGSLGEYRFRKWSGRNLLDAPSFPLRGVVQKR